MAEPRKTRLPADERRQAFIDVAMPLFAERGYDAVTTKEIASEAGVSEALLYRHFPGKRELYEAIQERCIAEATEQVDRLNALPNNTATLIACVYLMAWRIQRGPAHRREHKQKLSRLMVRSLLSDGDFARSFLARTSKIWITKLEACVEGALESGDLQSDRDTVGLCLWLTHHVSVALNNFAMPDEPVVDYYGMHDALLNNSVLFCLRGLGLTADAIEKYFNPEAFSMFINAEG